MDAALGIKGRDFVILMADTTAGRSILAYKHDEDKIAQLGSHQLLACTGENAARVEFSEYIEKNLSLMKLRSGRSLSNHAAANFIRSEIANALRSRGAYQANCLFASFDEREGSGLYYLDYLGTLQKVNYTAHGYCAAFTLSLMDKVYLDNITEEQAIELAKQCADLLARRFRIFMPKFSMKIINQKGIYEEIYRPTFREN